jgi:hypothetical protein
MNLPAEDNSNDLAFKIARLIQERGWGQEEFARIARLNRHTVRQILQPAAGEHRLRNATVLACANALGLTVNDLRTLPLEKLLTRIGPRDQDSLRRLFDRATQPELRAWLERNGERARGLTAEEVDELLALDALGGIAYGVEAFVQRLERRRELVRRVQVIAGTEYLDVLERLVELMYEKVQPNRQQG